MHLFVMSSGLVLTFRDFLEAMHYLAPGIPRHFVGMSTDLPPSGTPNLVSTPSLEGEGLMIGDGEDRSLINFSLHYAK